MPLTRRGSEQPWQQADCGALSRAYGTYSNWAAGYTLDQFVNFRANLDRLWFAGKVSKAECSKAIPITGGSAVNNADQLDRRGDQRRVLGLPSRVSLLSLSFVDISHKDQIVALLRRAYADKRRAYYEGKFAANEVAACGKGLETCSDRKRYTDMRGDPERKYNHASGFQDDIEYLDANP